MKSLCTMGGMGGKDLVLMEVAAECHVRRDFVAKIECELMENNQVLVWQEIFMGWDNPIRPGSKHMTSEDFYLLYIFPFVFFSFPFFSFFFFLSFLFTCLHHIMALSNDDTSCTFLCPSDASFIARSMHPNMEVWPMPKHLGNLTPSYVPTSSNLPEFLAQFECKLDHYS